MKGSLGRQVRLIRGLGVQDFRRLDLGARAWFTSLRTAMEPGGRRRYGFRSQTDHSMVPPGLHGLV